MQVEFVPEYLAGELLGRNVIQKFSSVDVYGMTARWLNYWHSSLNDLLCEIGSRAQPVVEIVLPQDLAQTLCDRIQVSAGQAAVRGESLGEDQQVAGASSHEIVVARKPTSDVCQAIFLGAHGAHVCIGEHLLHYLQHRLIRVTLLAQLDEVRVLSEAGRVDHENCPVFVSQSRCFSDVGHTDGLATSGVVGDGDYDTTHLVTLFDKKCLQPLQIDVALERVYCGRHETFRNDEVQSLITYIFDISTSCVEVGVA